MVGRYSLALAITLPIFVLAQLSLKNLYLTNRSAIPFASYHILQLCSLGLGIVVSVLTALLFFPSVVLTVFLVALVKANDALCDLYAGPMQEHRRVGLIVRGYGAEAAVSTLVVGVILFTTRDLNFALTGLAVSSLVLTAFLMLPPAQSLSAQAEMRLSVEKKSRNLMALLRKGLPIGLGLATFSLVITAPQYALAAYEGDSAVGYFTAIVYSIAIVDLLLNTVTQGWIPRARDVFAQSLEKGGSFRQFVARSSARWTLLLVPLTAVGLVLLFFVIPVLLGLSYALTNSQYAVLGLCILVSPAHHFAGVGLTIMNYYRQMLIPNVVAAIVTIGLSAILVANWGSTGAILAIVGGLTVKAALSFGFMRMPARDVHAK
jgi:O-antigen/teichoic acid export membrane protein